MFRISGFAWLGGVSAKTLRAWDDLGLLRPVWVDPATRYRYYSPAQLPTLRRILALRDVGVPLAQIADLVAGGTDLRIVLDRRRAELEAERQEVERRLQALKISVTMADGDVPRQGQAQALDVVVRPVASQPVATYAIEPTAGDLGPAFYDLEAYVRDVGRRAPRPPGAIVGSAGGHRISEIFVPLTGPIAARGPIGYRRLPACRAASIIHRGGYEGLPVARRALERWVDAAGLAPDGPLRILYLQFGAEPELRVPRAYLVDRDADFVTEVQLPIVEPPIVARPRRPGAASHRRLCRAVGRQARNDAAGR